MINPPTAKGAKAILRLTTLVTNPRNSIFYFGDDHMGVSPAAESLAGMLQCKAGDFSSPSPARVRYIGHAAPGFFDSKPSNNAVRPDDVLMVIECELDSMIHEAAGESGFPEEANVVLQVSHLSPGGKPKYPTDVQSIRLQMCRLDRPRQELAICSSPVYNWAPSLVVEWIEYHRILGVEHVYLYDRDGSYGKALEPLVKAGAVTVINWPSHCPKGHCVGGVGGYFDQYGALNACKQRFGHATEWLAHIDVDEKLYMAPAQRKMYGADFKNFLHRLQCNAPSVAEVSMDSIMAYGEEPGDDADKMIRSRNFKKRDAKAVKGYLEKYIGRAAAIDVMGVHDVKAFIPPLRGRTYKPAEEEIRINHHRLGTKRLPSNLIMRLVAMFEPAEVHDVEHLWLEKELTHRVRDHATLLDAAAP